jgi:hypothetical protein
LQEAAKPGRKESESRGQPKQSHERNLLLLRQREWLERALSTQDHNEDGIVVIASAVGLERSLKGKRKKKPVPLKKRPQGKWHRTSKRGLLLEKRWPVLLLRSKKKPRNQFFEPFCLHRRHSFATTYSDCGKMWSIEEPFIFEKKRARERMTRLFRADHSLKCFQSLRQRRFLLKRNPFSILSQAKRRLSRMWDKLRSKNSPK